MKSGENSLASVSIGSSNARIIRAALGSVRTRRLGQTGYDASLLDSTGIDRAVRIRHESAHNVAEKRRTAETCRPRRLKQRGRFRNVILRTNCLTAPPIALGWGVSVRSPKENHSFAKGAKMSGLLRSIGVFSGFVVHAVLLQAVGAAITLNDGGVTDLQAVSRDTNISISNTIIDTTPTSLPFSATNQTATVGASTSTASYNLSQSLFSITGSGTRAGLLDSRSNTQGNIFFSVSVNTPYALTGQIAAVDPGSVAKFVQLEVRLSDVNTTAELFHNLQESFGTVDQTFIVGGSGGNQTNQLSGSSSGTLLAGHRYQFFYGNSIYAGNTGDPATFTSNYQLSFVPEPSSAVLAILAVVGLSFSVYLRKSGRGLVNLSCPRHLRHAQS